MLKDGYLGNPRSPSRFCLAISLCLSSQYLLAFAYIPKYYGFELLLVPLPAEFVLTFYG